MRFLENKLNNVAVHRFLNFFASLLNYPILKKKSIYFHKIYSPQENSINSRKLRDEFWKMIFLVVIALCILIYKAVGSFKNHLLQMCNNDVPLSVKLWLNSMV